MTTRVPAFLLALVSVAALGVPGTVAAATPMVCQVLGVDRVPQGDSAPNRPNQIVAEWAATGAASLDCAAGFIGIDVWEHAVVSFPKAALDGTSSRRLTGRTELTFMMSVEDIFTFRGRVTGSISCDATTHMCDLDLMIHASGVNNNAELELHEMGVLNGDTEMLESLVLIDGTLTR